MLILVNMTQLIGVTLIMLILDKGTQFIGVINSDKFSNNLFRIRRRTQYIKERKPQPNSSFVKRQFQREKKKRENKNVVEKRNHIQDGRAIKRGCNDLVGVVCIPCKRPSLRRNSEWCETQRR